MEVTDSRLSRAKWAGIRNYDKGSMRGKVEPPTCNCDEPVFGRALTRSVVERGMGAQL
jgi:hypothetical protein